jgi:glycosyltransferase involved in cell wall biosynthesis
MTSARSRFVALVPAHDEAPRIGRVVTAALHHLPVVVVDDGSSDGTAAAARAGGAHVLQQPANRGKGVALRAGFSQALRDGNEAVITLDGDGQHDPAEIPVFLAAHARRTAAGLPTELVVGRRDFSQMPVVRRIANTLGTIVLSVALGRYVPDNQSGYRLVGRRLMAAMLDSAEPGFAFEVEMIAVCEREGWPVAWVPIRTIYGDERSHVRPLTHLREFLSIALRAGRIARSRRRWNGPPVGGPGPAPASE